MAFKMKGFPMRSSVSALKQVSSPMKLAEWEDHLGNVISEEDAKTLQGHQTEYDKGMEFVNQAKARYEREKAMIEGSGKTQEQIEYDLKILKSRKKSLEALKEEKELLLVPHISSTSIIIIPNIRFYFVCCKKELLP